MSKLNFTTKAARRTRRHSRVRGKVSGTAERPRLAVFRSNTALYAQLIDDSAGVTLANANSLKITKGTLTEKAVAVGEALASSAKAKGITHVVFDRGGFTFTGRIKALAEAARKGGLIF